MTECSRHKWSWVRCQRGFSLYFIKRGRYYCQQSVTDDGEALKLLSGVLIAMELQHSGTQVGEIADRMMAMRPVYQVWRDQYGRYDSADKTQYEAWKDLKRVVWVAP